MRCVFVVAGQRCVSMPWASIELPASADAANKTNMRAFIVSPQESMTAPGPGSNDPSIQPSAPASEAADNTDFTSDGAQMTTIPTPMLNVRYISAGFTEPASCKTLKTFGTFQLETSITPSSVGGSTRPRFSANPPPVMCAIA